MTFKHTRLRRYVRDACDGPFGSAIASEHYVEEGARVIRLGNIGSAEWLNQDEAYLDLPYWRSLARHHAIAGDLVVAALGDDHNPVGRAVVIPDLGPAIVKADCHRLRLDGQTADARFFSYYLSSVQGRYEAGRMADGSTRKRLTLGKTLGLVVPQAELYVQRVIADYLDAETARIDALIEKKQRMVELLNERRMTVMTDGVSGALTNERVRASTLRWLPTRAAAWSEVRLTLVAQLGSGHTPSREHPEWWTDCTILWITTGEVAQLRSDRLEFLYKTRERVSELGIANSAAAIHPAGTVVLCRTASAGYSAIMGTEMATSQDFATWTCGPLLRPRFLLLCLRAMRQDLLGRLAMGSTHKTIYMPDIEGLRIPLPSKNEQDEIVELVWRSLRKIDRVVDSLIEQIDLLNERRDALITAAVTGALDIPGVAA